MTVVTVAAICAAITIIAIALGAAIHDGMGDHDQDGRS